MKKQKTIAAGVGPVEDPARQGFYNVTQADGTKTIAEWREHGKNTGKRWHVYVSDDPTIEKTPVVLEVAKSPVVAYTPASKAEVEALLKRELTVDEQIESAYQSFLRHGDLDERYVCDIPPSRQVRVGDPIVYGNLDECRVVAVKDDGTIVVFSHHVIERKHGVERDLGTDYRAVYWNEVLPVIQGTTAFARQSRLYGAYANSTLKSVISRALRSLDDSPEYQRDYVWTAKEKEMFLDSIFAGRELGRFIFIRREYPHIDQVLDGKQRINCIREFVTSRLAYRGMYWHELSHKDRQLFEGRSIQYADLPEERFSHADFMEIFLEVNIAGVPQSEEHLEHVKGLLAKERAKEAR
jgi:hypothetical protein